MKHLENIFDQKESLISLKDVEIKSRDHLDWIANELGKNTHVYFINWTKANESIINEHQDIKTRIQTQLVSNILDEKNNPLVIDLSDFDIDLDFLTQLSEQIAEKPNRIGQVILGKRNQGLFSEHKCWSQIVSNISKNNNDFQRFPSDSVHCILANHCRHSYSHDISDSLKKSGWMVLNKFEIRDQDYYSILYKNELTGHLVLAFRGIKFDFNELLEINQQQDRVFEDKIREKLVSNCYYAYLHARIALEKSQNMSLWLSFTGHGFGAWLAELAVLYCYQENGTTRVRAVTFDSPGSGEMFYRLDESQDFNELLDITTYLTCPNMVNTSSADHKSVYDDEFADFTKPSHHLGAVYFLNDIFPDRTYGVKKLFFKFN